MGKILDLIKKHGLTTFGTFIAADGYKKSVFANYKQLSTENYNTGLTKEMLTKNLTYHKAELDNLIIKKNAEISKLTDLIGEGTDKSSIFGNIEEYLEWYKDFVSSLAPDQLVALVNIFGYFLLLTTLYNMAIIQIGNNLINKWNLEKKYPKLSKYIQYKTKINKYSMRFHFISIFIIALIWLSINIYMFLLRFFI